MALVLRQAVADHASLASRLKTGDRVLLTYNDRPGFCMEKILLYPVATGDLGIVSEWITYAPGGAQLIEKVSSWKGLGLMRGKRNYPSLVDTLVVFDNAVETGDLQRLVQEARVVSDGKVVARRAGVPSQLIDWDGGIVEWRPEGAGPVQALARRLGRKTTIPVQTLAVTVDPPAPAPAGVTADVWPTGLRLLPRSPRTATPR